MRRISLGGGAGRGVLALMTGTIGAQIVTFLALPFLSRVFTPEDFGFYSLVIAIAGVIAPAATLRLESAAMLPKENEIVRALVWVAITSVLIISLFTIFIMQVMSNLKYAELDKYQLASVWVGAFVFTGALYSLFSQLALRNRAYGLVARRSFARSVVMVVTQLSLGFSARISSGLLIGGLVGQLAGLVTMIRTTRDFTRLPKRAHVWPAIKRYWRFPVVFTPSAVLNALGLQAPLVFFTALFGLAYAGQLGMAERIVAIPVTLIGAAVGQVLDAEITKRMREGQGGLRRSYLKYSGLLAAAGLVVAVLGLTLGGLIVPWLLGEQWMLAGVAVQVLAVTSGIRLVASPLSKFMIILQKSFANTVLDLLRVVLMISAMIAVSQSGLGFVPALWVVYSALSVTYVITWFYGLLAVKSR